MEKPKIILTGGGTGGHITPNLALLPYLDEFEIHYVGQPDSLEEELCSTYKQIIFHGIKSVKFNRSLSLKNLAVPFVLSGSVKTAKQLLKQINPKVIFSKGGFVSLPVCLAAKNIPLILHESDYSMGLANKLIAKKCRYVCTSFEHLAKEFKNGICTGAPLRQSLYLGDKNKAEAECNLKSKGKNLLVFGGSMGAKAINEVILNSINELTSNYNVVHISGKNNKIDINLDGYFSLSYTQNIADYFAWADLVVCRGGANALFELAALKKPALVIPLPKSRSSRGDQCLNAADFESRGFVRVLEQKNLCKDTLLSGLKSLDNDKFKILSALSNAKNLDGAQKIANLIKECASCPKLP